jgi:hypothetical protein
MYPFEKIDRIDKIDQRHPFKQKDIERLLAIAGATACTTLTAAHIARLTFSLMTDFMLPLSAAIVSVIVAFARRVHHRRKSYRKSAMEKRRLQALLMEALAHLFRLVRFAIELALTPRVMPLHDQLKETFLRDRPFFEIHGMGRPPRLRWAC